ncbi:MAG: two-component regulator propeller domain-containing protein, partial [Pseudomonadota bacterium]
MGMSINGFITAIFVLFMLISVEVTAQVKRLSPSEGLSQSYVNTMLIDNNGYLWLSTEGGLNRYDGYQVIPINGPNGELEEAIIDRIYQDQQGHIWIASLLAGLFRYDPKTDTYQQYIEKPVTEEQILQQSVFTMLATDDKTLWIGQGREFAKLDIDNGSITSLFTLPEQFENAFVRTLFHYNGYIF